MRDLLFRRSGSDRVALLGLWIATRAVAHARSPRYCSAGRCAGRRASIGPWTK